MQPCPAQHASVTAKPKKKQPAKEEEVEEEEKEEKEEEDVSFVRLLALAKMTVFGSIIYIST